MALLFWRPKSKSSIHDQGQTISAVTPIIGTMHETKYEVIQIKNQQALLTPLETVPLDGSGSTPISPEPSTQVHLMANMSDSKE